MYKGDNRCGDSLSTIKQQFKQNIVYSVAIVIVVAQYIATVYL